MDLFTRFVEALKLLQHQWKSRENHQEYHSHQSHNSHNGHHDHVHHQHIESIPIEHQHHDHHIDQQHIAPEDYDNHAPNFDHLKPEDLSSEFLTSYGNPYEEARSSKNPWNFTHNKEIPFDYANDQPIYPIHTQPLKHENKNHHYNHIETSESPKTYKYHNSPPKHDPTRDHASYQNEHHVVYDLPKDHSTVAYHKKHHHNHIGTSDSPRTYDYERNPQKYDSTSDQINPQNDHHASYNLPMDHSIGTYQIIENKPTKSQYPKHTYSIPKNHSHKHSAHPDQQDHTHDDLDIKYEEPESSNYYEPYPPTKPHYTSKTYSHKTASHRYPQDHIYTDENHDTKNDEPKIENHYESYPPYPYEVSTEKHKKYLTSYDHIYHPNDHSSYRSNHPTKYNSENPSVSMIV